MKNPVRRSRRSNPSPRGRWVITAVKKRGGRFYYAGGARLASEAKEAIEFPSIIHAETVKTSILTDFPRQLTKAYHWQVSPRLA